MTEQEIRALPFRGCQDIQAGDRKIGATEPRWEHSAWCWEEAYERPSTGERFKVFDFDNDQHPTDPSRVTPWTSPICFTPED